MKTRIAINGFGRIGRLMFRATEQHSDLDIVAINDLTDVQTLAHLLKYDSSHGRFHAEVKTEGTDLVVNGRTITVFSEKDPSSLPWADLDVAYVAECTGHFRDRDGASKHLTSGARRVIISAPAKNPDWTVVMGVNEVHFDPRKHHIISNASCTTNCLAPVAKVLLDVFGIECGMMTTIHSYTNDQRILDLPHKDLRRARAAAVSMIPTTTGAAAAVGEVLPELQGRLNGMAIRVPTPNVSIVDFVVQLATDATAGTINDALKSAARSHLSGIMEFCEEPLVSIDFNGSSYSSVVDGLSTMVMNKRMAKVLAWYDNENGYATRLRDIIAYCVNHGG
ncbi:type I glyceraldehyde-3-phosphate dehydrogenase [bacterium]|nr:type I glyceraldehyde-3-phosphate dehydrogenase [candidate division CSSED10-310 bacterium]